MQKRVIITGTPLSTAPKLRGLGYESARVSFADNHTVVTLQLELPDGEDDQVLIDELTSLAEVLRKNEIPYYGVNMIRGLMVPS